MTLDVRPGPSFSDLENDLLGDTKSLREAPASAWVASDHSHRLVSELGERVLLATKRPPFDLHVGAILFVRAPAQMAGVAARWVVTCMERHSVSNSRLPCEDQRNLVGSPENPIRPNTVRKFPVSILILLTGPLPAFVGSAFRSLGMKALYRAVGNLIKGWASHIEPHPFVVVRAGARRQPRFGPPFPSTSLCAGKVF